MSLVEAAISVKKQKEFKLSCNDVCKYLFFVFKSPFILNSKNIKMGTKTFNVVTTISMAITLTVATLSIIGVIITGFYPGIIMLLLLALIPIASKLYAKKNRSKSNDSRRNHLMILTIINLLSILVVFWMTFVILVDRVFSKIL